jgi:hypothetical protein
MEKKNGKGSSRKGKGRQPRKLFSLSSCSKESTNKKSTTWLLYHIHTICKCFCSSVGECIEAGEHRSKTRAADLGAFKEQKSTKFGGRRHVTFAKNLTKFKTEKQLSRS